MKYPTWKVQSKPTPNDTLYICDKCQKAEWCPLPMNNSPWVCWHENQGKQSRMRQATEKEKQEALKSLKEIIK